MNKFKNKSLEERTQFAKSIMEKHPGKIPLIIESNKDKDLPPIHKFIIPNDLTVGQVIYMLRKRIKLNEREAIYVFFKDNLLSTNTLMSEVYEHHKDSDGIVYAVYAKENTFGSLC
jgi:GABA(A) receptor-associated protein